MEHLQFPHQINWKSSKPLWQSWLNVSFEGFAMQLNVTCLTRGPCNFLFTQCIILQWLYCLFRVNSRGEDVVQAKLPGKDIFHDMYRMVQVSRVSISIKNVWSASAGVEIRITCELTYMTKTECHFTLCIQGGTGIKHSTAYKGDRRWTVCVHFL